VFIWRRCSIASIADLKATFQLQILGVKKNPQSPMYTQLGVLTKGTVIEVNVSELGMVTTGGKVVFGKYAQLTNNPENDGCVNAVLREFPYISRSCASLIPMGYSRIEPFDHDHHQMYPTKTLCSKHDPVLTGSDGRYAVTVVYITYVCG